MSNRNFFIHNLILDIGFFSKDKAGELQNRVSSLFSQSLSGIIEDVCDRTIPTHTLVKADQLTLDIGTIRYDNFESDFSSKLQAVLLDYFSRFLLYGKTGQEPNMPEEISFIPLADRHISLFESFLLTGTLPAWAAQAGIQELEKKVQELLSREPDRLYSLIRSAGGAERVRRRLAFQFSEPFIEQVVQLLQPQEAPFIISYKHNVTKVVREEPLITTGTDHFHKEIWLFILTFLIVESGSLFSRLELIKSTLKKIAARFHISYHRLLAVLKQSILITDEEGHQPEFIRLIEILTQQVEDDTIILNASAEGKRELAKAEFTGKNPLHDAAVQEDKISAGTGRNKQEKNSAGSMKEVRWLVYFLRNGSLPLSLAMYSRSELEEKFVLLFQSHPEEIKRAIHLIPSDVLRSRIYQIGGNKFIGQFTEWMARTEPSDVQSAPPETGSETTNLTLPAIRDLLYHFLQTGFLPWWAFPHVVSLQGLLENFISRSPEQIPALLRFAGSKISYRKRLFSQFSPGLIMKLFTQLPGGQEAAKAFETVMAAIKDAKRKPEASVFIRLIWKNYILHRYQSFNTVLYYVRAVRQLALLYHIPVQQLSVPLKELVENDNMVPLQDVINHWLRRDIKHQPHRVEVFITEEEIIRFLLSQARNSVDDISKSAVETTGRKRLTDALTYALHYFFTHWKSPVYADGKLPVAADTFAKAAMLLLTKLEEAEAERLLLTFDKNSRVREWITRVFDENTYRERQILLLLNRLCIHHAATDDRQQPDHSLSKETIVMASINSNDGSGETANQTTSLQELTNEEKKESTLPDTPLWQQFYRQDNMTPEKKKRKMIQVLSFFLTWHTFPQTPAFTRGIQANHILKEIIVFLFAADRESLHSLLNKDTNLREAVIRVSGLFKAERGGTERLLVTFIQPALRTAMIDCLWDHTTGKSRKTKPVRPVKEAPANIFSRLTGAGDDTSGNSDEQQAMQWLDFFLSYNKLPGELSAYRSAAKETIGYLTLFLFRKNRVLLENLFQKQSHQPSARIRLHGWILTLKGNEGKELARLSEKVLQKDVLSYIHQFSGSLLPGNIHSLEALWKSNLPPEERQKILTAIAAYPGSRETWMQQVPEPEIYRTLHDAFPYSAKSYIYLTTVLLNLLNPVLQSGYERESLALHSKVFLLLILAGKITITNPATFINRFFQYLDHRKPAFTNHLYQKLQSNWQKGIFPKDDPVIVKELQKAIAARLAVPIPAKKKETHKPVTEARAAVNKPGAVQQSKPQVADMVTKPFASQSEIEPGTKIYVNNAGLVLMHPFIPTYFMLTGLTGKGDFISEDARQRAVLLLQYMAHGTTEFEEPELVLNKILCGLPLEEPVPSLFQPTEKEIQITAELFTIVFQRWERMKSSTAEGFRYSFLRREGQLTKGETKWAMRVDQRGYDAILTTMPWSFGFVKLPWMPLPVETEWI